MQIAVIGTGYVGLTIGTCLSDMGHKVICVDNDLEKIKQLNNGIIPIYEPGLEELIKTNLQKGNLFFIDDLDYAVKSSLVCFITVGTPQSEDGSADLSYVYGAACDIAAAMNDYKVIVNKSTVPVGTAKKVKEIIGQNTTHPFDVVSNPEFLKQGHAVADFLSPDRVIIGSDSKRAESIMKEIYSSFLKSSDRIISMDIKSAELTKYASNSFLALKISYINEIANISEAVGADINKVRIGMCSDSRIGTKFLYPGLGYGGSCFPKDVKALIKTAHDNNCDCDLINSADKINEKQRLIFVDKILKYFNNDISNKTFAIWGLAFKPKTNDIRQAPSTTIIQELLKRGAKVKTYDPKAMDGTKKVFNNSIEYSLNSYQALKNADALLLLTEWNEFRNPDFNLVKSLLKNPIIFDGRNQYDENKLIKIGFDYICIGKKSNKGIK